MAVAAEVPSKYDCVINGEGFRFAESEERAAYGLTPTFATRRIDEYGDNSFEFWFTYGQNDWSGGSGQLYYRADEERSRQFWRSNGMSTAIPGRAELQRTTGGSGSSNGRVAACAGTGENAFGAGTTNLYEFTPGGTESDRGAHGLGAAPRRNGIVCDGADVYLTTTGSGTVGVRKWNGATFSTFSASAADSLAMLNNSLYGLRQDNAKLVRWDTSGAQSDLYQWKDADGAAATVTAGPIRDFGNKLLILFSRGPTGPSELWQYDGVAPTMIHRFDSNFYAYDLCVVQGGVFISGSYIRYTASGYHFRPAIQYYVSGSVGTLWEHRGPGSEHYDTTSLPTTAPYNAPPLAFYDGHLFFIDSCASPRALMRYNPTEGYIEPVIENVGLGAVLMVGTTSALHFATNQWKLWPDTSNYAAQGTLDTSLIDFDSSLTKYFKSVRVDFENSAGGTVRLSYRLNDLDTSSITALNGGSGVTSGTEYSIGASGSALGLRVTVTPTSTASPGPVIRRLYVRAAPILDQFKRREYTLDLSGADGESPIALRDGSFHTKDGHELAAALNTTMLATTPFSITDRFGTFTGLIEPDGSQIIETRPGVYRATIRVREV